MYYTGKVALSSLPTTTIRYLVNEDAFNQFIHDNNNMQYNTKKLSIVFMSSKADISYTLYNVALTLLHSTTASSSFQEGTL